MKQQNVLCPANGLPCAGKEYLAGMMETMRETQFAIELAPNMPGLSPEADGQCKTRVNKQKDEVITTIERDLQATCNGRICGPLGETASRFIFDGSSHAEVLQNIADRKKDPS